MVPSFLPQTSTPPSAAVPGAPDAPDAGRADGMPADAAFDCALDDACAPPAAVHGETPLPAESPNGRRTLTDWWLSHGLGSPASDTAPTDRSAPVQETDADRTGEDGEDERPLDAAVTAAADAQPQRTAPLPVPADPSALEATASVPHARPVIDDASQPERGDAPSNAPAARPESGSRAASGDVQDRQTRQRTGGATTVGAEHGPAQTREMPEAVAHAAAHANPAQGPAEPALANGATREGRAADALSTNSSSSSPHPAPPAQDGADSDAYTMTARGDARDRVAQASSHGRAAAQAGDHPRPAATITAGTALTDAAADVAAITVANARAASALAGERSVPSQTKADSATGASAAPASRPAAADGSAHDAKAAVPPMADAEGTSSGSTTQRGGRESGQSDHGSARDLAPAANAPAIQPPTFTLVAAPDGTLRLTQLAAGVSPAPVMTAGQTTENVERMVQAMRVMIREKVQEATVHLRPEHFGDVRIDIRVEGKSVTALVQTEAAGVREWLLAQEPLLRSGLSEQGLTLERLLVDRDPRHQRKDQAPDRHTPRRQRRAPEQDAQQTFEISV